MDGRSVIADLSLLNSTYMTERRDSPPEYSLLGKIEGAEKAFLRGPRTRHEDLESVVTIFLEFLRGFESFDFDEPCVTVFGSSRFGEDHDYYGLARDMGGALARAGFAVMTGGGPGLMEAANRGAKEAGGLSLGCNIQLPREQKPNAYLDKFIEFEHFFVRKVMLVKYSSAFVVMPGLVAAAQVCTRNDDRRGRHQPRGYSVHSPDRIGRRSHELPAAAARPVSRRARVGWRRISAAAPASDDT